MGSFWSRKLDLDCVLLETWPTRDSSVGRAEDCSMIKLEILRSAVRLRLAGTVPVLRLIQALGRKG